MENPLPVAVFGPLEPFAARFASSLIYQGYRRQSALIQIRLFAQLSAWLVDEGLEPRQLSATDVERFPAARRQTGATRYVSGKAMRAILTYLGDEGVLSLPPVVAASGPVDVTLERYRQYLTQERGLAATTARLYVHLVRPFVSARVSPDGLTLEWEARRAADGIGFVVARTPHQSRGAADGGTPGCLPPPLRGRGRARRARAQTISDLAQLHER